MQPTMSKGSEIYIMALTEQSLSLKHQNVYYGIAIFFTKLLSFDSCVNYFSQESKQICISLVFFSFRENEVEIFVSSC